MQQPQASAVGLFGQIELRQKLMSAGPKAIPAFQSANALQVPNVQPVYDAFQFMNISRHRVHSAVFERLSSMLREKIQHGTQQQLLRLLDQSFPYISVAEVLSVSTHQFSQISHQPHTIIMTNISRH
jgi:hypothetical protein